MRVDARQLLHYIWQAGNKSGYHFLEKTCVDAKHPTDRKKKVVLLLLQKKELANTFDYKAAAAYLTKRQSVCCTCFDMSCRLSIEKS